MLYGRGFECFEVRKNGWLLVHSNVIVHNRTFSKSATVAFSSHPFSVRNLRISTRIFNCLNARSCYGCSGWFIFKESVHAFYEPASLVISRPSAFMFSPNFLEIKKHPHPQEDNINWFPQTILYPLPLSRVFEKHWVCHTSSSPRIRWLQLIISDHLIDAPLI